MSRGRNSPSGEQQIVSANGYPVIRRRTPSGSVFRFESGLQTERLHQTHIGAHAVRPLLLTEASSSET